VWRQYWQLATDPFSASGAPYVSTSGHDEALARLLDTIESGQRRAVLRGGAGTGKSTLLTRLVHESRRPSRRFVRVARPETGTELFAALASGLGVRPRGPESAWKALTDAMRLGRWQKLATILIVDDSQTRETPEDRRDLERLEHVDSHPAARFCVVLSWTDPPDELNDAPARPWDLAIQLPPLLRSESMRYVAEKLAAAGRSEPAFTPRALVRLHDLSEGVPRGLDRLATLALMAGALRRREVVTPDVIDAVALECEPAA
jgi:MSHA biogenesis protein MshM